MRKPPINGPETVPIKKLDSSLANFTVRLLLDVVSATYAKAAGLVAEPTSPLTSLPKMSIGNKNVIFNIFFSAKNKGVIKAIKENAYPNNPNIAIFLLPYLSLALPHIALVKAHATAEKANINET